MSTETKSEIHDGCQALVTEDTKDFDGGRLWRKGDTFEVEEVITDVDPEADPDDEITVPFVYGSTDGGYNNVCLPLSVLEVAQTAQQMRNRALPDAKKILAYIASEAHGGMGDSGFEFDESEPHSEGGHLLVGTTDEGLRFAVVIDVKSIYHADF